jgi:hypothetical protein
VTGESGCCTGLACASTMAGGTICAPAPGK